MTEKGTASENERERDQQRREESTLFQGCQADMIEKLTKAADR